MAAEWTRRGFMFVAGGIRNNANLEAQTIMAVNEAAIDQADTFGIELSPTGNAPTTHYACNTALRAGMVSAWVNSFFNGHPTPSSKYYIIDVVTGELLETNTSATLGAVFGWPDALADAGWQVIAVAE